MKLETLQDRIQKAEEKITKKQNTITKKTATIAKKTAALAKVTNADEKWWLETDIENLEDDIKRLNKEIAEAQKALEGYKAQLPAAVARNNTLTVELPENLRELQKQLVEIWDEYDIEHRDLMKAKAKELGYTEFVKAYGYREYEGRLLSDEQIHKANLNAAEEHILNLVNRVKETVGDITAWDYVHLTRGNCGPVLNGYIIGTKGRCSVESIGAGGYNIQRYHIRVLVKAL